MKIVINKCWGGFGLSDEATLWLWEQGVREIGTPAIEYHGGPGSTYYDAHKDDNHWQKGLADSLRQWKEKKERRSSYGNCFSPDEQFCLYVGHSFPRNHPKLIECVELFGEKANGDHAKLTIVEIPDGVEWEIDEYDGQESIHEVHRSWA